MKTTDREFHNPEHMRCTKCNRPYETTVIIQDGKPETYLQCWGCFRSIKLHSYEPRKELETLT